MGGEYMSWPFVFTKLKLVLHPSPSLGSFSFYVAVKSNILKVKCTTWKSNDIFRQFFTPFWSKLECLQLICPNIRPESNLLAAFSASIYR